jgi:Zn-dependent M16 (insulinase) family peptidase
MCLAYYLAHYRDAPHFKTADIAKLNTEAAQRKFANTAYTLNNAATTGYFVGAMKGHKQLTSMGEQYVEALPDRAAAKAVVERSRPRKPKSKSRRK